ncbi:MAG TPA: hypothetical protein VM118_07130, partial [Acidobacteriota bacterium]|nr:hypothetical protein [Acidobacteriota bacterium]
RIELIDHVAGKPDWGQPLPNLSEWDAIDIAIYLHPSRADLDEYWAPYAGTMSQSGKGVMFLLDGRFAQPGVTMCPYPLEFCRRVTGEARGEFASEPVASRQNHPLVRLDPTADWERTRRIWTERPPWAGVVVFDSLPDNADVLVQTVTSPRRPEAPLMWTRPLGRGRSVVLTGGPLWRWVAEQAAAGRAPDQYNAFWENTLRWLILADDADRLAVRSDREVYHSGEPIMIEGLVFDEAYRFLDRAAVTARVWRDTVGADTVRVFLNPGAGDRFVAPLSALTAGTYRYDGTAEFGGTTADLSGGVFRVESYGLEEQYSGLDEALLRAVAAESGPGGRYISEHELLPYLDSLDWMTITRERPVEFPLGNHWLVLAIFIAALSVEWFVRRRQQLL